MKKKSKKKQQRQSWKSGLIADFEAAGVSTRAIRPITRAIARRVAHDPKALVRLIQIGTRA